MERSSSLHNLNKLIMLQAESSLFCLHSNLVYNLSASKLNSGALQYYLISVIPISRIKLNRNALTHNYRLLSTCAENEIKK